jgi:hypothetical protein
MVHIDVVYADDSREVDSVEVDGGEKNDRALLRM